MSPYLREIKQVLEVVYRYSWQLPLSSSFFFLFYLVIKNLSAAIPKNTRYVHFCFQHTYKKRSYYRVENKSEIWMESNYLYTHSSLSCKEFTWYYFGINFCIITHDNYSHKINVDTICHTLYHSLQTDLFWTIFYFICEPPS